jgi:glutaconate CoA-transferase subunit B
MSEWKATGAGEAEGSGEGGADGGKKRDYTDVEFMICLMARSLEDEKTIFVGYGMPQIAAILGQRLYSPDIVQVYEYGAVGPDVATPFMRNMMADSRNSYRAVAWTTMVPLMEMASVGLIDYGVLGAAQIDPFGNINSTQIGPDYNAPKRRFAGSGGGNEVASLCWKTIIVMQHQKRKFLEKVDFITSPGFLDGSPGAREKAGLPRGTGPHMVITSKAQFDYHPDDHRMRIIAVAPDQTVEAVLEDMEFKPHVAGDVKVIEAPRPDELKMLREVIDPDRVVIGRV